MCMPIQWETNFQHKISTLCQKMMSVLSQHSPGSSAGGVEATDGYNIASLEMQRYIHMYTNTGAH